MKLLKWLDQHFEESICVFLMSSMSILLFIQVVMRRVFGNSLTWSEELARYIFIWLIYFGISYGAKAMKHIKIEAFLAIFPRNIRPFIKILGNLLFLAFALFVIFTSFELVQKQIKLKQQSPAMHIPMWVVYSAPLCGFVLTSVRQLQVIILDIRDLKKGGETHG
ncbi:MAG: TRAP transporter small permease [Spirochaetaceae bacterium]|jgi:TRAP-type C4-dicarboxylate transport system permease small subunit|nr:TRAP transporter small permease [Spirochaetaceae bacterium]